MKDPNRQARLEARLLVSCPFALVLSLITTLARGGGRESALVALLSTGIPIVLTICVILLGMRVLGRNPPGAAGRSQAIFFMVLGILLGVVVLFLRFTAGSHDKPPVRSHTDSSTRELRSALADWSEAQVKLSKTRWQQTAVQNPSGLRQLSLDDLRAFGAAQRDTRDNLQRVDKLLKQMDERGTLASARRELVALGVDPDLLDPVAVGPLLRVTTAARELSALMEANWDDWKAHGLPEKEAAVTYWQKEARRLIDEIVSLETEIKSRARATATP